MKKIMLLILDGFGLREELKGNAVKLAQTPIIDKLIQDYPYAELEASGESVGLPAGQMGNSEVGHMTIGSGRTIMQSLSLINSKIKSKEFFSNEVLLEVINHVNENNSVLHLIGILSDGGVHSSINHFYATLALAKIKGIKNVYLHFITDGRDTSPKSGKDYIFNFMNKANKLGIGEIATISGRYYAMDRDEKWERTRKAYNAICYGIGNEFNTFNSCMDVHYKNGITDEFINPSIIKKNSFIKNNDGVIFINFRPDRMKQLIDALTEPSFKIFKTTDYKNVKYASIFKIHDNISYAYENEEIKNTFGEYLMNLDYKQIRIAETEKFEHVTHFFDGTKELSGQNYHKVLIPSPQVLTYDMKPEMSIGEVTEEAIKAIDDDYDFILVNFANPDMVGHTGNLKATLDAIEICDFCVGKIYDKAKESFYELVITADHGNAEYMIDENDNIITSHTTNKVPFIICNNNYKIKKEGYLRDVIPTIIDMYEIKKPDEMNGESLIVNEEE